jgi:hypothetical protein
LNVENLMPPDFSVSIIKKTDLVSSTVCIDTRTNMDSLIQSNVRKSCCALARQTKNKIHQPHISNCYYLHLSG